MANNPITLGDWYINHVIRDDQQHIICRACDNTVISEPTVIAHWQAHHAPTIHVDTSVKQVIIIRTDLEKMSKGKAIAQASHGVGQTVEWAIKHTPDIYNRWNVGGYMKITLKAKIGDDLLPLYAASLQASLPCFLVVDAGRTELPPNTPTALVIGPGETQRIDAITRSLKLM